MRKFDNMQKQPTHPCVNKRIVVFKLLVNIIKITEPQYTMRNKTHNDDYDYDDDDGDGDDYDNDDNNRNSVNVE
jgi:hypothetical protein